MGFFANAQYHPMVEEGKEWNLFYTTMLGTFNSSYKINGDTLVGGEIFKKLYLSNDLNPSFTLSHLLKEDTSLRQVEIRPIPPNGMPPVLTLDFSLNLGDTVFADCFSMPWYMIVDSVFQFQIAPGEMRKAMFLDHYDQAFPGNSHGTSFWIEGLGTFAGPVAAGPTECISDIPVATLLCVKDSANNMVYDNPDYANCSVLSSAEQRPAKINFFPNPVKDFMSLTNVFVGEHYVIMDVSGRSILEGTYEGVDLKLGSLVPGLYFLRFESEKAFKFVKE